MKNLHLVYKKIDVVAMCENLIHVTFFEYFDNRCKNIDKIAVFINIFVKINYKLDKNTYFNVNVSLKLFQYL